MKTFRLTAFLCALAITPAFAADMTDSTKADLAAKTAQVELLRARASLSPSATTTTSLIEAENLLRQLREAPPDKRDALRAQLEAALARLELELDAAGQGR